MKHVFLAGLGIGFVSFMTGMNAFAGGSEQTSNWYNTEMVGVDAPTGLSGAEQEQCTQVIIDQINSRTGQNFTADDVVQVQMPGWSTSERGFIRGGGYNIRVVSNLQQTEKQTKHLKSGRFASFLTWLRMGDEASLHLPNDIDGKQTFFKSTNESGTHVDFVAHVDSAYAYLPLGLFDHLFKDVAGADTRNPCPIGSGHEDDTHINDNESDE